MVIREEKKVMADKLAYIRRDKKLTPQETEDYRRKKLVEVRKGTGAGRPIQARKKSSVGYTPIAAINAAREREYQRVLQSAREQKEGMKRQKTIKKEIKTKMSEFEKQKDKVENLVEENLKNARQAEREVKQVLKKLDPPKPKSDAQRLEGLLSAKDRRIKELEFNNKRLQKENADLKKK
tara:strand:+ start:165 stop:704 length:540 start_codon:yes stop_codon:yes gene_type:complete